MSQAPKSSRRAVTATAMVIALVAMQLAIVGAVVGGERDQTLTLSRLESVRAFYAAEAGMNMALREVMLGVDEDGDGAIGTISNDSSAANDPQLGAGGARVFVTQRVEGPDTVLISTGVSGSARQRVEAFLR